MNRSRPNAKDKIYDLACRQERLEAFVALGGDSIQVIISQEDYALYTDEDF